MFNRIMLAYILLIVLLTACGGGASGEDATSSPQNTADPAVTLDPDATPESLPPTPEEEVITLEDLIRQASQDIDESFIRPTFDPQNPSAFASELVIGSADNPFAGVLFDYVSLTQRGGPIDLNYTIEVYPDGRVVQDGREGRITPDAVAALQASFDTINLFAVDQVFNGLPLSRSPYYYDFTVRQAGREFSIEAQDAYLPPELTAIFATILDFEQALN